MHAVSSLVSPKRQNAIQLDLTPLIDVVFLLLIFFMVSTTFDQTTWLDIELPGVDDTVITAEQAPDQIIIAIDAQGGYRVNESAVTQDLQTAIAAAYDHDAQAVVIQGDAQAPHAAIVHALEILGQLNITQVHIAALVEH